MKILAVSDVVLPKLQDADYIKREFADVEALISCGDMPPGYLDYLTSHLAVPLFFVRGNHDTHYEPGKPGGDDLHRRIQTYRGFSFAGLEGSINYNNKPVQYAEGAMLAFVLQMMPRLLLLRSLRGYGVDLFVAHSPPQGIHDIPEDYAHRGFKAFLYLMRWTQPRYFIHGHVDTWDRRRVTATRYYQTEILNINPMKLLTLKTVSEDVQEARVGETDG